MKVPGKVCNGPVNKCLSLNFGGAPDHGLFTDPDPYLYTGKTCLGGGVHCPNASSYHLYCISLLHYLGVQPFKAPRVF